ncbi:MAG: GNAT family N-acetyltransferase [Deltaproteobacteria bacterium]|nr:GNAT family N-acetyltransferase [Deltaproteobacteria bacterium]
MMTGELAEELSPALKLEHVQDATGLQGLRVSWTRLWYQAGEPPFLSWPWMTGAWARLHTGRRPLILVARTADGELVGVLPLSIQRSGPARVARFLADETVGSDYLDALASPSFESAVKRALWTEALHLAGTRYDVLELREMLEGSLSTQLLREQAGARGLELEEVPGFRCPYIAIQETFEQHLSKVSRADNLKRRKKQLEREEGFEIAIARTDEEIPKALEDFLRLHALRWKSDGGSQGITSPRVEAFHRDVARRLAREELVRLYTLKVKGQAIASVYMLGKGERRFFYQSGYDPAFSKQSPGLVLLARTIEDAFTEGAREYDFLHGSEPYKFEWATGERRTVTLRSVVPTLRGRAWSAGHSARATVRSWGQSLLGGEGYEALRRLRRRWAST